MLKLSQIPSPGCFIVRYRGDRITVVLKLSEDINGEAFFRTNCEAADIRHSEKIAEVEHSIPALSKDWHDIPMPRSASAEYKLELLLNDAGAFEGKAFFIPAKDNKLLWPDGENMSLKVHPARISAFNTVYCAFVRQFGPFMSRAFSSGHNRPKRKELEKKGYNVIPPSGTFRNLVRHLDLIMEEMGFRIIQLLPVNPVPTTYARMGTFGSPYASLDFFDVDSSMAEFDKKTTPLEQFSELVDAVHARKGLLFIDIPVNHTGWASKLHNTHPEWFARNTDDTFTNPGAWGIVWGDLLKLDMRHKKLWEYLAEIFLFWCRHGVDGFRLDAGYMLPFETWQYVTFKVRSEYPDTVFLLEGLGGDPRVTENLLAKADMNWAYSELFQNYSREQVEYYLSENLPVSLKKGPFLHFSETHDNNRLAATSKNFARLRTALCSMLSDNGAFGITNGVEWYAREKIDVHKACGLNWGDKDNMTGFISRINRLLALHPVFWPGTSVELIHKGKENCIAALRVTPDGARSLCVLVNLDHHSRQKVRLSRDKFTPSDSCDDLISGKVPGFKPLQEKSYEVLLEPGQVCCLTNNPDDRHMLETASEKPFTALSGLFNEKQMCRAKVCELIRFFYPGEYNKHADIEAFSENLTGDTLSLIRILAGKTSYTPVVSWKYPQDARRVVPLPGNHVLYIEAPFHFRACFEEGGRMIRQETSLVKQDGTDFLVIIPPETGPGDARLVMLHLVVYKPDEPEHINAPVFLSGGDKALHVKRYFSRPEFNSVHAVCTNQISAATQVRGSWGEIQSKYDAFLAANLDKDYPVNRTVLWTRCRIWLRYRGYSFMLSEQCQSGFRFSDNTAEWDFHVPCGNGLYVALQIQLHLEKEKNLTYLKINRLSCGKNRDMLADGSPVSLIIRPDIDCRDFHTVTKAFAGAEKSWPRALKPEQEGFRFSPDGKTSLLMNAEKSEFIREDEWSYMVALPQDRERGLDDCCDLYSPGYFEIKPAGGSINILKAGAVDNKEEGGAAEPDAPADEGSGGIYRILRQSIKAFLVNRDGGRTVIAGYPWFLDWGRDTLISLRGIISAGFLDEARSIILTFCRFEKDGTLPNMICGEDSSNRDTSDAQLWLFAACADFMEVSEEASFLETRLKERTVMDVLVSIAENYMKGTPGGISMDKESGLIFSPSHFTWMDTNFPAATPREGYPVEIQALWFFALDFLSRVNGGRWEQHRDRVRESIERLYVVESGKFRYFADLLCAPVGVLAKDAVKDDSLRPNQLLTISLGAVDDTRLKKDILDACADLLVPGAVRSLADKENEHPLHVRAGGRNLLNPRRPYTGIYTGDEDSRRKPAYHNGTAWTWLFPSYCEALLSVYGAEAEEAARSLINTASYLLNNGCVCHMPEITDGDAPHRQKGCGAQAWGVTELYRILQKLF